MQERSQKDQLDINKMPRLLELLLQARGCAIFGKIYLEESFWKDYSTGEPNIETLSIIAHEITHVQRFGRDIKKLTRYWVDRDFRFKEELAATREEMRVLKKHGKRFPFLTQADALSGPIYRYCTDIETAEKELRNMWDQI